MRPPPGNLFYLQSLLGCYYDQIFNVQNLSLHIVVYWPDVINHQGLCPSMPLYTVGTNNYSWHLTRSMLEYKSQCGKGTSSSPYPTPPRAPLNCHHHLPTPPRAPPPRSYTYGRCHSNYTPHFYLKQNAKCLCTFIPFSTLLQGGSGCGGRGAPPPPPNCGPGIDTGDTCMSGPCV